MSTSLTPVAPIATGPPSVAPDIVARMYVNLGVTFDYDLILHLGVPPFEPLRPTSFRCFKRMSSSSHLSSVPSSTGNYMASFASRSVRVLSVHQLIPSSSTCRCVQLQLSK